MSLEIAKTLPHNREAEACVLGAMLIDNDAIGSVTELLEASDFYERTYRTIYEATLALFEQDHSVDAVTLKDRLTSMSSLEDVGGVAGILSIQDAVPSAANVVDYATIVKDHSTKRRLIALGNELVRDAYSPEGQGTELIETVEGEIFKIASNRSANEPQIMKEIIVSTIGQLEYLEKNRGRMTGCGTDFYRLDKMTNGFQSGDLCILAARPSMGKTTFAINCAVRMALNYKKSVAFFSLEMSKEQIATNMLCAESRVKSHHIRQGNLNRSEWMKIVAAAGRLNEAPILIDDSTGLSVASLRGKARRLKREHDIDCIIVDYLQLMDAPRAENRQQEISLISRSLKGLARELEVPIIALSQINRSSEKDQRKPRMSDLRESGAIEQDADLVMFLWRQDYQNSEDGEAVDESAGRPTQLIMAKQRNGPTGSVHLLFHPVTMSFEDDQSVREASF